MTRSVAPSRYRRPGMRSRVLAAMTAAVALTIGVTGQAGAIPIPSQSAVSGAPEFIGKPAKPHPVKADRVPRHPFMARNGRSVIHNNAYQTDTYTQSGPLGNDMTTTSTLQFADCGSVTFDRLNRIVTVCVGVQGPRLVMLDPRSLKPLASYALPPRKVGAGTVNVFTDFSGGGYFYLDNQDRAVVPTTNGRVLVIATTSKPGFELRRTYDVADQLADSEGINSALPAWNGLIWFVGTTGSVGAINPTSGEIRSIDLDEDIENSFAVDDSGGVYVVTDRKLYRLDASRSGKPTITWRERYPNDGVQKPGQTDDASGTTPTLMGEKYVAITDNADPVAVEVYRRERRFDGERRVCRRPVFERGASSTDQSLIGAGRSIIAENNYGYTGPAAVMFGRTTRPGLERVDLDRDGHGCRSVWRSPVTAPSVVPKLSLANGLVYTYTKEPDGGSSDPWYLTALDFRTGRPVWRRLSGTGFGYNNNYAPVTIGPDGTAYVGVLGGLTAFRDAGR